MLERWNIPTAAEAAPLWSEYRRTRSVEARNALVVAYRGLVQANASHIVSRLPLHVDPDDYVSVGTIGLMRAIAKFDPCRNTRFTTFATQKIRGAILDELRNIDPLPRKIREHSKKWNAAKEQLCTELGRDPTRDEMFQRLNVSPKEFARIEADAAAAVEQESLSTVVGVGDTKEVTIGDQLAADTPQPDAIAERHDLVRFVLDNLPPRYSMWLGFYFIQGQTMRQIGKQFDLSESRISQAMGSMLRHARQRFAEAA